MLSYSCMNAAAEWWQSRPTSNEKYPIGSRRGVPKDTYTKRIISRVPVVHRSV